jgi:deoxyribonuclease-4
MKIGAHVSIAQSIQFAPKRAFDLGCECFQIFSRSPQGGNVKPIEETTVKKFIAECNAYGFELQKDFVIHSPYFINLASDNNRIYYGSISALRRELEVATMLQCPYVITHIGSSKDLNGDDIQSQINDKVIKAIKKIYEGYTGTAMLLLEIAAGSGNIIGDTFEEIAYFLQTAKKEKVSLGFCFDTCHSFAAGYDLRTAADVKSTFEKMDQTIGLENLKYIHFNDSKTEFNSKKDRHEHIGLGKIGAKGLFEVAKIATEKNINLILETEHDKIAQDLALVKKFRKQTTL